MQYTPVVKLQQIYFFHDYAFHSSLAFTLDYISLCAELSRE